MYYLPTYPPTHPLDALPNSLIDLNANSKMKIMEEKGIRLHSFACNTSRGRRAY